MQAIKYDKKKKKKIGRPREILKRTLTGETKMIDIKSIDEIEKLRLGALCDA